MLRSDHRELRNSNVKLGWWVVVVVGVQGKDQYCSCSVKIEMRASQSLSIIIKKINMIFHDIIPL